MNGVTFVSETTPLDSRKRIRHSTPRRRPRTMSDSPHRDPVQEFADRIVAELEKGVKPWVRPWDPQKSGGPQAPFNPATGKRYHGINVLILGMDIRAFQTGDPRWMTYQQAHEKHWQVRKGEKATAIFFTKQLGGKIPDSGEDETPDRPGKQFVFFMKTYAVFHASQIVGVPEYNAPGVEDAPWTRPEAADVI